MPWDYGKEVNIEEEPRDHDEERLNHFISESHLNARIDDLEEKLLEMNSELHETIEENFHIAAENARLIANISKLEAKLKERDEAEKPEGVRCMEFMGTVKKAPADDTKRVERVALKLYSQRYPDVPHAELGKPPVKYFDIAIALLEAADGKKEDK